MRARIIVSLFVAVAATVAMLMFVPGCRAQSSGQTDGTQSAAGAADSKQQPRSRSLADVARGYGLEIGPRNASALQAEQPAAAAFRDGKGPSESMFEQAAADASKATPAADEPDSWDVVTQSLSLFKHAPYVVDLLIGFGLSIVMALLLTTWPKSLVPRDPVAAIEERNGGLIVALVGCLAAELVQSSEQLSLGAEIALVLFGIGGLIRFRTVFGDPRRTGLMILITILGLCCGVSQYALAVLAFVVIWFVRYFLLSHMTVVVQVRPRKGGDMEQARTAVTTIVANRGVVVQSSAIRRGGKLLELQASCRGALDEEDLRQALEDALPGARVRVTAS